MQLYDTIKRMVGRGQTDGLQEKLDVFYALDRLTKEQYEELSGLIG